MTTLTPFSIPSQDAWKEAAKQALKGADFERTLYKASYEGLTYEGLYTQRPEHNLSLGTNSGWQICQPFLDPNVARSVEALHHDQKEGLEAAEIDAQVVDDKLLLAALKDAPLAIPLYLKTVTPEFCLGQEELPIAGLLVDPLGHWVKGHIESPQAAYKTLHKLFKEQPERKEPLRYLLQVSSLNYAEAGAHAVQEIAFILASCVEAFQQLLDKGLSCEQVLSATRVKVSVGTQFFMDLAKIRALRFVLHRLANVYDCQTQPITLHARTLQRTLSRYDIHNNYLRQSLGAAAAVLGGIDSLGTGSFNEINGIPDQDARRMARNIQLVLKHEAYFEHLLDPARGSFFIENLSCELAEAAWKQFQDIEKQGGMERGLRAGRIQSSVSEVAEQRMEAIATRQDIMVGVNLYASALEKPDVTQTLPTPSVSFPEAKNGLDPLNAIRPATRFEDLREDTRWQNHEVLFLCFGPEKGVRPRHEFMQSAFATVGLTPAASLVLKTIEEITEHFKHIENKPNTVVFCGSDEAYEAFLPTLLPLFKAEYPQINRALAGRPKAQIAAYKDMGLTTTFYAGGNLLESLQELL